VDSKERIKKLPNSSGVYIFKDAKGVVLYVGKAGNIKKRVSSYFYKKLTHSAKTQMLLSKLSEIETIPTSCEAEALILESSLIKRYKPKYNIALKDDKSYPYLKLTLGEKFPRILMVRKLKDDGSRYFGPYTNAKLLRQAANLMKRIFRLRTCNKLPKDICLDFYLGQCLGPCTEKVSSSRYNEAVRDLVLFLEGKKDTLLRSLSVRMALASRERKFEEAAKIRDRVEALSVAVKGRAKYRFNDILEELARVLELKKPPKRIEAFDVSNLYGVEAVGSMIAFYDLAFDKSSYRKFRIKTVDGIDDYKMMREIVRRRYKRVLDEKLKIPDLIIIDGGKGHLRAAKKELDLLGVFDIPVIGIAKEFEHIYLPDKKDPIKLPRNSGILHLIQNIRDEAHRFAIYYHRHLRDRRGSHSELDDIKGVGQSRKRDLLKHFGNIANIKKARLDDLIEVKSIDKRIAKSILSHFKR